MVGLCFMSRAAPFLSGSRRVNNNGRNVVSEGTLWITAGQSASRLISLSGVIGRQPVFCCLEFRSHVGASGRARALIWQDSTHRTSPCQISMLLAKLPLLAPPPHPPALFFQPRGSEISVSRAPWARASSRRCCAFAAGAQTYIGHFATISCMSRMSDARNAFTKGDV